MKQLAALLLSALFASAATAASVKSGVTVPTPVTTGSEVRFEFTLNTDTPVSNAFIAGYFGEDYGRLSDGFLVLGIEPPGPRWECNGRLDGAFGCATLELAPGSYRFVVRTIAPNVPGTVTVRGNANGSGDQEPGSNGFSLAVPVTSSGALSDISLNFGSVPAPIPLATAATLTAVVRNNGPSPITNAYVLLEPGTLHNETTLRGWTCEWTGESGAFCQTGPIAPGGSSQLEYDLAPQESPRELIRRGELWVAGIEETKPEDNHAAPSTTIGTSDEFTFVLLPVAVEETAGAHGARWRSDARVFMSGTGEMTLFPQANECRICTCIPEPPFGWPLDSSRSLPLLSYTGTRPISQPGLLVYVEKQQLPSMAFSIRVRDVARATENAGTELPAITERDLRRTSFQLLDIPMRPDFRHLLRIYDPHATADARVAIRVYAANENATETLIGEMTTSLLVPETNNFVSPLQLPYAPGYAEIPLNGDVFPALASAPVVRVEVTPLTENLRIWGFISLTNNLTNLITTITPQPAGNHAN